MTQIARPTFYALNQIEDRLGAIARKFRLQQLLRGLLRLGATAVISTPTAAVAAHLAGVLDGSIKPLASGYPNPSDRVFEPMQPPPPHPGEDMFNAIKEKDAKRVKEMLDAGFDPNGEDLYGGKLFNAAVAEDTQIMKLFLDHGADPNQVQGSIPALYRAVNSRDMARIQMLLDAGANINHPARSVLIPSSSAREPELVRYLLMAGANPNAQESDGGTSLHAAAFMRDTATIAILLEFGADPTVRNKAGETPLDFAVANNRGDAVIQLLRGANKKE